MASWTRGMACWSMVIGLATGCSSSAKPLPCEPVLVHACDGCAVDTAVSLDSQLGDPSLPLFAPAVDADGTAAVGACDEVWHVTEGGKIEGFAQVPLLPNGWISQLSASRSGDLYVQTASEVVPGGAVNGTFIALASTGEQRWEQASVYYGVAATDEGPYVGSLQVIALNPDGTTRWSAPGEASESVWMPDQNGHLVYAQTTGLPTGGASTTLAELDMEGNPVWGQTLGVTPNTATPTWPEVSTLGVGADGSIAVVVGCDGGTCQSFQIGGATLAGEGPFLVVLDASGNAMWSRVIDDATTEIAMVDSAVLLLQETSTGYQIMREDASGSSMALALNIASGGVYAHGLRAASDGTAWFLVGLDSTDTTFGFDGGAFPKSGESGWLFHVRP